MDDEARTWAENELGAYDEAYNTWATTPFPHRIGPAAELARRAGKVLEIADRVRPGLSRSRAIPTAEADRFRVVRDIAAEARGLLQAESELLKHLGPKGPQLAAEGLHPWVWEPAAQLWSDGHRREAIQAAATQVELHLQAKTGRPDLAGSVLAMQAFEPKPPSSDMPRLRFRDAEEGSQTWRSQHEGAKFYGAGVFLAVRNIATHTLDQPEANDALERLAALSLLARLIERAEPVYAEPA